MDDEVYEMSEKRVERRRVEIWFDRIKTSLFPVKRGRRKGRKEG